MKEWVLGLCALGLLTTLICLILPQGKLSNMIKGILSLLVIIAVINPIINADFHNFSFDMEGLFENVQTVNKQEEYLEYVLEEKRQRLEGDCDDIILQYGADATTKISADIVDNKLKIEWVSVSIKKWELNDESEHKDIIEEIKNAIADYLNVSQGIIRIYE